MTSESNEMLFSQTSTVNTILGLANLSKTLTVFLYFDVTVPDHVFTDSQAFDPEVAFAIRTYAAKTKATGSRSRIVSQRN